MRPACGEGLWGLVVAGGDDVVGGGPEVEVAFLDGGGHEVWEEFGGAGEAGDTQLR